MNKPLTEYSVSELQQALIVAKQLERAKIQKMLDFKNEVVSKNTKLLLELVQNHSRSSCNDDSFRVMETDFEVDSCVRCILLYVNNSGYMPSNIEIVLRHVIHDL